MSMDTRNTSPAPQHYWRRRWSAMMDELFHQDVPAEQQGQRGVRVRRLSVGPGRIDATVHQRSDGDCDIVVRMTPLDDAQWEALVDLVAGQALYSAQLLAGEIPVEIDRTLERAGISLFPTATDEIAFSCSCHQAQTRPCPAVIAVLDALGEMLNDDPWLLLRLRGRERQVLLRMLRSRRNRVAGVGGEVIDTDASALVYRADAGRTGDESPGLDEQLDDYWGRSREQLDQQHVIAPPLVETALLRRLGPAPFEGGAESQQALAAVYQTVTRNGLALAYAPDPESDLTPGDLADTDDDPDVDDPDVENRSAHGPPPGPSVSSGQ